MKKALFTLFLSVIFCFYSANTFSQRNPFTNGYEKMPVKKQVPEVSANNPMNYSLASGVPCAANSFWAIFSGGIDLFTLNAGVVTKVGTTVITGSFDPNLAYCNNLNGGSFSPTFYSTQNYNQPVYYNGSGVTPTTTSVSPDYLINCGGNGNYLYYIRYDPAFAQKGIARFDGSTVTTVYNIPASVQTSVADLAVDTTGNVWFFTGPKSDVTYVTDTLNVVSPTGQLIKKYPFPYNTDNAYGCFLLHGTLYVALGDSNHVHPHTLLPITITPSAAIAGTPITMPVTTTGYSDMASCTTGAPLAVTEHKPLTGITVYPNPVSDQLTINSNTSEPVEIILYDITAREILHKIFTNSVTLKTDQLPKGVYLYRIINPSGGEQTGKIVKE